jgi:hypothetical protein
VTGNRLAPWEVVLITDLDDAYLAQRYAELDEKNKGNGTTQTPPGSTDAIARKTVRRHG